MLAGIIIRNFDCIVEWMMEMTIQSKLPASDFLTVIWFSLTCDDPFGGLKAVSHLDHPADCQSFR
jgi:hypothetical protein